MSAAHSEGSWWVCTIVKGLYVVGKCRLGLWVCGYEGVHGWGEAYALVMAYWSLPATW